MAGPLRIDRVEQGRIARVSLDAGKGNVLTRAVIEQIGTAFEALGRETTVRAVVLTAEGNDFSFGASVPEHVPGEVEKMLPVFSNLFRTIAASGLPVVAAVRGRCLGGGFELALAAHWIVAAEDAKLGVPEVTLGVFPPIAAALLPFRVRQPVADRLVTLGETITGSAAFEMGVVDEMAAGPEVEARAHAWAKKYSGLSGTSVRHAIRASRAAWDESLGERLSRLERAYLTELMATHDAREGIAAFMERRTPAWRDQ